MDDKNRSFSTDNTDDDDYNKFRDKNKYDKSFFS